MSAKPLYEVVSSLGQDPEAGAGPTRFSAQPLADLNGKKIVRCQTALASEIVAELRNLIAG